MAEDDLREASRGQWSRAADGWGRETERRESGPSGAAADWMLSAVALEPGERVLELASGAGEVGLRAAEAVGPSGRVVVSDFAEPMVELVGDRARSAGLGHVEGRVLDAEDPRLEGERFDAVLCRFGYMLMADPARALRESCAALDRAGRIALAVWGPAERNPWQSLITDAVMKTLGAPPPAPGMPGPFALADHERLRSLLAEAGFVDIVVEDLDVERQRESVDEWWAEMLGASGPLSAVLGQLADAQRAAVRDDAQRGARRYAGRDGSVRFPARVVVASARRATDAGTD